MIKISVGDPSISWHALQPQSDVKNVLIVEGASERVVGLTTEDISVAVVEGKQVLQRTQTLNSIEIGNRTTTSVIYRSDFQPITHLDETDEQTISIRYDVAKIIGVKSIKGSKDTIIERHLSTTVFDSHTLELILRLLPLDEMYSVHVPVYHVDLDREIDVDIKVTGQERVESDEGKTDAWIVETDWGHLRQWYWIDTKGKQLLKQSVLSENFEILFAK